MRIKQHDMGNQLILDIDGHITGISEVNELKIIFNNSNATTIELNINDAFVVPSAFIGILVRLVQKDKKSIKINTKHQELQILFKELSLDSIIDIRIIS